MYESSRSQGWLRSLGLRIHRKRGDGGGGAKSRAEEVHVGGLGGVSPGERRERGDNATRDERLCFDGYLDSTPRLGTVSPLLSLLSALPLAEVL